MAYMPGFD